MTIHIELRGEEERVLRDRARQSGRDPVDYVQQVIKEHLEAPAMELPQGSRTFAEVFTPVWEGFRDSGLNETEAGEFLENELRDARRERKPRP